MASQTVEPARTPLGTETYIGGIEQFSSTQVAGAWFENAAYALGQRGLEVYSLGNSPAENFDKTFRTLRIGFGTYRAEETDIARVMRENSIIIDVRDRMSAYERERIYLSDVRVNIRLTDDAGGEYVANFERLVSGARYYEGQLMGNPGRRQDFLRGSVSYVTNGGSEVEYESGDQLGGRSSAQEVRDFLCTASALRSALLWRIRTIAPEVLDTLEEEWKVVAGRNSREIIGIGQAAVANEIEPSSNIGAGTLSLLGCS